MSLTYHQRILALAQCWKTGDISIEQLGEFNLWYEALEGGSLGDPDGITVERVEMRLYEQFKKYDKPKYPNMGFRGRNFDYKLFTAF